MHIHLHVGLEACASGSLQATLQQGRKALHDSGILFPLAPGKRNHTKLAMASTDPDTPDNLRLARGLASSAAQAEMREKMIDELRSEILAASPDILIFSNEHCSSRLLSAAEVDRLRDLCLIFSNDISVHFFMRRQSEILPEIFSEQVRNGRTRRFEDDFENVGHSWWDSRFESLSQFRRLGSVRVPEIQIAPPWLDFDRLLSLWENSFGSSRLNLHSISVDHEPLDTALAALGIGEQHLTPVRREKPSLDLEHSEKLRQCNIDMHMRQISFSPAGTRSRNAIAEKFEKASAANAPELALSIQRYFQQSNERLLHRFPQLSPDEFRRDGGEYSLEKPLFSEEGYNASAEVALALSTLLVSSHSAPRQKSIGPDMPAHGWSPTTKTANPDLKKASTGIVLVATMRDEGPFLLEWLAHHRAIGVNNFLIFTNDCSDGTDTLLDHLDELGMVTHVRNIVGIGGIPHQEALNQARNHPLVRKADWIIHIDADEFINIHIGNGTLAELIAATGEANFIAMTWRLFGCNAHQGFEDRPVIEQFTRCAPAMIPKPHTAWGFKTMYRNIGAYRKLGVHRPNKLNESKRAEIRWVNGSGEPMPPMTIDDGWRSDRNTIGYQMVSLNHYAVRSAEAFLVKRARGRANHASRTLGLNYWIRMDFNSIEEPSMLRHLSRVKAEIEDLKQDQRIAELHQSAVDWYKRRIGELKSVPEYAEMLDEINKLDLTDAQRIRRSLEILNQGDA